MLHLRGRVLVDDATELDEVWVVDGRLTFASPPGGPTVATVELPLGT